MPKKATTRQRARDAVPSTAPGNVAHDVASRALITGAILMASGRVPITQTIFFCGNCRIEAVLRATEIDFGDAVAQAGTEKRRQTDRAERASRRAGSGAWARISLIKGRAFRCQPLTRYQ